MKSDDLGAFECLTLFFMQYFSFRNALFQTVLHQEYKIYGLFVKKYFVVIL